MTQDPAEVTISEPPFDDRTADVVLRSIDSVHFYVYRVVLSLASPFFKDLFNLKQPDGSKGNPGDPTTAEGLPIIDVQENSRTLDVLLRICYPIVDPVISTLPVIGDVLEAAMKYEMEQPKVVMKKSLCDHISASPLQAFAVACRLNLEDEASEAARTWQDRISMYNPGSRISTNTEWSQTVAAMSYVDDMKHITAGSYFRLLTFLRTKQATTFCEFGPTFVPVRPELDDLSPIDLAPLPPPTPPVFDTDEPADLLVQSSDGTTLRVHKIILSLASPIFKKMIQTASLSGELPMIEVDEPSSVLVPLLQLCYPMQDPILSNSDLVFSLLRAATKYSIARAIRFVQRCLQTELDIDPLRMFFISIQHNWKTEARDAALRCCYTSIEDTYVPEMDIAPASVYHSLIKFHFECRQVITSMTFRATAVTPSFHSANRHSRHHHLNFDPRRSRMKSSTLRHSADFIYVPVVEGAIFMAARNKARAESDMMRLVPESQRLEEEIEDALEKIEFPLVDEPND